MSGRQAAATIVAELDDCAGHFHAFPTLPVAVLIGAALELEGHLVDAIQPAIEWMPDRLDLVDAKQLVPAEQSAVLHATPDTPLTKSTRCL